MIRNTLAHDYPETSEEKAAAVELAREMAREMASILNGVQAIGLLTGLPLGTTA